MRTASPPMLTCTTWRIVWSAKVVTAAGGTPVGVVAQVPAQAPSSFIDERICPDRGDGDGGGEDAGVRDAPRDVGALSPWCGPASRATPRACRFRRERRSRRRGAAGPPWPRWWR